jgi:heme/copper-type cytochrome/quinol oxidase subunit 2
VRKLRIAIYVVWLLIALTILVKYGIVARKLHRAKGEDETAVRKKVLTMGTAIVVWIVIPILLREIFV